MDERLVLSSTAPEVLLAEDERRGHARTARRRRCMEPAPRTHNKGMYNGRGGAV
jgi:hypothetical protein